MTAASSTLTLYHMPGACSRVILTALFELELLFEDRVIDLFAGEQHSAEFLAINPKGKIPALRVGDDVVTELPAIVWRLVCDHPGSSLFPGPQTGLSDLCWLAGTIHPLARNSCMPSRSTTGDGEPVRIAAEEQLAPTLRTIADRIAQRGWWYGDRWSICDVYFAWILGLLHQFGRLGEQIHPFSPYRSRVADRESSIRALTRERESLAAARIALPPGFSLDPLLEEDA